MQYELQKLERMSLEDVRAIAVSMGLNPRRSQSIREISYAILDAQADNRAAAVQAKEEARAEILYQLESVDNIDGLIFVHGYHGGKVLKDLVRNEIKHYRIAEKVFVNASATAYRLKKV